MSYKYCCSNCFNIDKYPQILKEIEEHPSERGDCPVCGKKSQLLVETSDLKKFFAPVFSKYEEAAYGENYHPEMGIEAIDVGEDLSTCIEEDFQIFNPDIFDKVNDLIDSIRGIDASSEYDYTPASCYWCRKTQNFTYISAIEYWDMFCGYIKHKRRFILDWNHLPFLLDKLFSRTRLHIEKGTTLYRARKHITHTETPFNPNYDEMGAPNPICVNICEGRANPAGISYLYLANSIETALKEIKVKQNDIVTIAEFEILEKIEAGNPVPLQIADLTLNSVNYVDIFASDEKEENHLANMIVALNENMSKQVTNKLDYIPTQFLSEAIRDLGFDGLRFDSSLDTKGLNYVFFMNDPNDVSSMTITKTYLVKIVDEELNYEIIKDSEKISDIPPMPITSYKVEHDSVLRRMFK